jgi:hypothetical protein
VTIARGTLFALLAVGAIVRIIGLPLPGTEDVPGQKAWAFGASQDYTGAYGVGGHPLARREIRWSDQIATINYGPVAVAENAASGHLYRLFHPDFRDSVLLNVMVKLAGLCWEIVLVIALLTWGRRLMGTAAEWAALAFWLSPGVWVSGSALGYTDAQAAVPIVLALIAALANRPILVGVLTAVGVLTKPQGVFVIPLLAVLCIRRADAPDWRSLWRAAAAGTAATFALCLPFVIRGSFPNMIQGMARVFSQDMLSAQAANLGWIGTWLLRVRYGIPDLGWHRALNMKIGVLGITRVMELGYPNARVIGTILTASSLVWVVWRAWRGVSRPAAAALAAWAIYAYFIFNTQEHENHLYSAIPLLALAAGELPAFRPAFYWVSGIVTMNEYLFYGFGYTHPSLISRNATFIDTTVVLSVINVCVFAWFTRQVAAATRRPPAAPMAAGQP